MPKAAATESKAVDFTDRPNVIRRFPAAILNYIPPRTRPKTGRSVCFPNHIERSSSLNANSLVNPTRSFPHQFLYRNCAGSARRQHGHVALGWEGFQSYAEYR